MDISSLPNWIFLTAFRESTRFSLLLWKSQTCMVTMEYQVTYQYPLDFNTRCHCPTFNLKIEYASFISGFFLKTLPESVGWTGMTQDCTLSLCINKGQGTLFYLNNSYTSNNNANNNNNKRLLIIVTKTILVFLRLSLLLFELPTIPWLLVLLFLNKNILT